MPKTIRRIFFGMILVALSLAANQSQEKPRTTWPPEYLQSGNPCWPAEQTKKQIKAMTGIEVNYIKCYPLRINMTWDFEETFHHHGAYGDDRFLVTLWESFGGYIEIFYDQVKRSKVTEVVISGPAPCCPGKVEFAIPRLHASILGSARKGFSGEEVRFFEADAGQISPSTVNPGLYDLRWRQDGLNNKTAARGPDFRFNGPEPFMPKPFHWAFSPTVMQFDFYRVSKSGGESPSWEELRPFFEMQDVWQKEYPLEERVDVPVTGEFYALRGKVTVQVDFAEQQTEEWLISVAGKERDPFGALLETKAPDKSIKQVPLNVEFDWQLEGKFLIKKRKGVRSYDHGTITRFDRNPRLLFDATDLFSCDLVACGGNPPAMAGLGLFGQLQGQNVKIQWGNSPAEACVLCVPKGSSGKKVATRKKLGTSEFTQRLGQEWLPLRDGAVKTGAVKDWLNYRITLKKIG